VKLHALLISALDEVNLRQVLVRTLKQWVHKFKASYTTFTGQLEIFFFFYVSNCLFPRLVYLTHFQRHSSYNQSHSPTSTYFSVNDNKNNAGNE